MVAVTVLSSVELLLPGWLSSFDTVDDDISSLTLRLPLLTVLSVPVGLLVVLTASLGAGLCGLMSASGDPYWLADSSGTGDMEPLVWSLLEAVPGASSKLLSFCLADLLILDRFDTGSRNIL